MVAAIAMIIAGAIALPVAHALVTIPPVRRSRHRLETTFKAATVVLGSAPLIVPAIVDGFEIALKVPIGFGAWTVALLFVNERIARRSAERREPRDRNSEHDAFGPHHSHRFCPCRPTIVRIDEMVERPHQQRCVERVVCVLKVSRIAELRRRACMFFEALHSEINVKLDWVNNHDVVTQLRQFRCVDTGAATNINDPRLASKVPPEQFHRANELETRCVINEQPTILKATFVELGNGVVNHANKLSDAASPRNRVSGPQAATALVHDELHTQIVEGVRCTEPPKSRLD